MTTAFTFVPAPQHEYPDHPERPGRLDKLALKLASFQAEQLDAKPAKHEEIARVHTPHLITGLERVCREQAPGIIDYAPTFVTKSSFEDAMLAAGATLSCARSVIAKEAKNAFAIVRPPGHHAEPDQAMGFCIFNNIAVTARDALAQGLERVMVVDYDAHHGNGTQAVFLDDERTAYLSTHQAGIYPGTGHIGDAPHAKGRIVNVPLPAYAGNLAFARIIDEVIQPMVENFKPDMLFVSAGFDSHWSDPLTMLGLSSAGFFNISKRLVELAEEHCNGKIVFVLEGGYDPTNVANGVGAVFKALAGRTAPRLGPTPSRGGRPMGSQPGLSSDVEFDAGDASPHGEPDVEALLEEVRKWHGF